MNKLWRDLVASALAIFGGVVVFAKLQSYDWWFLGSWKGALGVLALTGLLIALTNIAELMKEDAVSLSEALLWLATGTFVIVSLLVDTTKAEFVASASLIGVAWVVQMTRHLWESTKNTPDQFIHAH